MNQRKSANVNNPRAADFRKEVRYWLKRGVPVLPYQWQSKKLVSGFGPLSRHIQNGTEADVFWQDDFFGQPLNMGIATGTETPNGYLAVVDCDSAQDFGRFIARAAIPKPTQTVATGRGYHLYFWLEQPPPTLRVGENLELRGQNATVLVPPSIHPLGTPYRCIDSNEPFHITLAALLDKLQVSERDLSRKMFPKQEEGVSATRPVVVKRIKDTYDLLTLARSVTPLEPSQHGVFFRGRCPFHDDHNPSFWVRPDNGTFGCFGCGLYGDVINFYARMYGLSNSQAIAQLASCLDGLL